MPTLKEYCELYNQSYERKGYSKSWIEQRERGITTRHNLTDEWKIEIFSFFDISLTKLDINSTIVLVK